NTYALRRDSTLWAWGGEGTSGQMGNGTTPRYQIDPVEVDLDRPVMAFSAGGGFGMAVLADSTVWTWGLNSAGGLGVTSIPSIHRTTTVTETASGGMSASSSATTVQMFTAVPLRVTLPPAVAVAGGGSHALALTADSTVWAWGTNGRGALGQPETVRSVLEPIQIDGLRSVVAIGAGEGYSVALKADGSVWIWGAKGLSGGEPHRVHRVPGLSDIAQIEIGHRHAFAVNASGDLWGWGLADMGQVGAEASEGENDWPPLPVTFRDR
ncbi:MAG: hypothetical protein AAFQ43_06755, partial [Bacteroidota bacterium]